MIYQDILTMEPKTKQGNALIGLLFYKDNNCLPSIFLDFVDNPSSSEKITRLYDNSEFTHFALHVEGGDGSVAVEAAKDLLDGTRLEKFAIKFIPDVGDDIDAFLGMCEITRSWALVMRLAETELHFIVSPDTDEVMLQYSSNHVSDIRRFPSNDPIY